MKIASIILAMMSLSSVHATECREFLTRLEGLMGREPQLIDTTTRKESYSSRFRGVPRSARWFKTDGTEVFRHYVGLHFGLREIVESSRLRAGNVNYVVASPMIRDSYEDLTGIFMTRPEFDAKSVGVDSSLYVDFKLPPGLKVLELKPGILLLPGDPARSATPRKQLIEIVGHSDIDHELATSNYGEMARIQNARYFDRLKNDELRRRWDRSPPSGRAGSNGRQRRSRRLAYF